MGCIIHIVLVEPQIPPNTGNIARFCAAMNCSLHLVKPLGFSTDEKTLRRAGMDYWQHVDVFYHDSLDDFEEETLSENKYYVTTKSNRSYTDIVYQSNDWLVFGSEDYGLKKSLLEKNKEKTITIPMPGKVRCLNLSSAVAVVGAEAVRQLSI